MESCFTCYLKTDDFLRITDGQGVADVADRAEIFGQHFWFTHDEYHNQPICHMCWAKIEDFHNFYSHVKSTHLQHGPGKVEIKVESLEPFENNDEAMADASLICDQGQAKDDPDTVVYAEPLDNPIDSYDSDDGDSSFVQPTKKLKKRSTKSTGPLFDCHHCHEESAEEIMKFLTYFSLKKHSLKVHKKSPIMYCPECDRKYFSEVAFNRHSAMHKGKPIDVAGRSQRRKNEHSNLSSESAVDLNRPNDAKTGEKHDFDEFFYYQKRCTPEEIEAQDALIRKFVTLACSQCDHISDTFRDFRRHGTQAHGIRFPKILCCENGFTSRTHLYDHCLLHINPEQFKCEPCGKTFKDSRAILTHNWTTHTPESERPYKCNRCSKSFVKEFMLARHITYHRNQEEKTFYCKECDLVFTSMSLLKKHNVKQHGEATQWLCDICAEPFAQQWALKEHRCTHNQEDLAKTMVQCEKCGKWLSNRRKYNTQRHKKKCTGGEFFASVTAFQ